MTIRKLIHSFRHFGEDPTGFITDDTTFSDLAIWEQLVRTRASIVKALVKSKHKFSEAMIQTIPCIMFEEVEASECNLIPPSGCKILKSTCETPNFLHLVGVSSQLGNKNFDVVRWDQLQGKLNSRILSLREEAYVTMRNINGKQFTYIINDSYIENLVVMAIAEDPIIFAQFCGNKEALCNPLELNAHTDEDIKDLILKATWDTIFRARQMSKPDIQNNDLPLS